jgi:hypothetical protein
LMDLTENILWTELHENSACLHDIQSPGELFFI